jgi:hypothetical protein
MKMVKSLLLGSAAGLAAVTAGQAADLPVKAKPVEYVKVCSLYGAGFYYMPGTDICLKIGGYVRAETTYHSNGNFGAGPTGGDVNNRTTNEFVMRARAYITADAREQTAFGTARAYVAVGVATTDVGNALTPSILGFNRAFIQWAGITAGITQSFYDFLSSAAVAYRAYWPTSDTGDAGWWVWGYTAQLGNGLSATVAAEQRRMSQIVGIVGVPGGASAAAPGGAPVFVNGNLGTPSLVAGTTTIDLGYGGETVPDIVGNIRLDQTWGSAQIMGAGHNVNPNYYGASTISNGLSETGHPGDQWGWVAGAGLRWNFPFIAQGDYFQTQASYTQGALRYLNQGNNAPNFGWERGGNFGFGVLSDCVYGSTAAPVGGPVLNGTGCNLTTGWQVNASYEHYWTPQFHESVYGGITEVRYDSQANDILCAAEGAGEHSGSLALAKPGCNNSFDIWSVGSRLQYDITKSFYIGVDFLYQHLDSASLPGNVLTTANTTALLPPNNDMACVTGTTTGAAPCAKIQDMNNLAVTLRMHKDFLP